MPEKMNAVSDGHEGLRILSCGSCSSCATAMKVVGSVTKGSGWDSTVAAVVTSGVSYGAGSWARMRDAA